MSFPLEGLLPPEHVTFPNTGLRRTKNSDYVLLAPRSDGHLGEMAMIVRTQKPLSCCAGPSGSKTQTDSLSQQGRLGSKLAGVYGTIHLSASRQVIEDYFERSLAEHSQEGRKAPENGPILSLKIAFPLFSDALSLG
ncbi:hypothetical protein I7I51_04257 [Histoplasma capsulatum]|uniref:Uncharacterized protein n=1 Tax=Ajellomyces capsulatus TaxID=5037 RepID=A0A8A1MA14_AJECA|nr:hypothetical protein I7I51_04257 [Histoplasma capsulatum]